MHAWVNAIFIIQLVLTTVHGYSAETPLPLNFSINENLLALQMLNAKRPSPLGVSDAVQTLRAKAREAYPDAMAQAEKENDLLPNLTTSAKYASAIQYVRRLAEFQPILRETQQHLHDIKNLFDVQAFNGSVYRILDRILKFSVDREHSITVLSPQFSESFSIGNRQVLYGSPQLIDNHALIHIVHECLHTYLDTMTKPSDVDHAIIELAIDYQLRKDLNSKDSFLNYTSVGHTSLHGIRSTIGNLHWESYLRSRESLVNFAQRMNQLYRNSTLIGSP